MDRLKDIFRRQEELMKFLEEHDRLPPWPVDLTTKQGQRMLKEIFHNTHEELFEASYLMKNKTHRFTDDRKFDEKKYKEELGDALAYFVEICILSGYDFDDIYEEYCQKNKIVQERFINGY